MRKVLFVTWLEMRLIPETVILYPCFGRFLRFGRFWRFGRFAAGLTLRLQTARSDHFTSFPFSLFKVGHR